MAPVALSEGVMAGGGAPRRETEGTRVGSVVVGFGQVGDSGGRDWDRWDPRVYLQLSLHLGGLVLRSRPQGTTKRVEPHVHETSTVSGQG